MINFILKLIFGTKSERDIKKLMPIVNEINALETKIKNLSDNELRGKTNEFKKRLKGGATLDDILPEAFAVVRETARRILGERHYDVQLIGGIVLHQGKIAEMKTGEGKTLSSTLPIYLNALAGKGVHVVTVNDYLARRDREWMGPIYEFLGLSVGVIQHDMALENKKIAYNCDITYGTNNEFGFDYLRDNMVPKAEYKMQRGHPYCIIDEVDSILIDEARTPLIISGPSEEDTGKYYRVNKIIKFLKKDEDFELDEKAKSAYLTEKGQKHVEELLKLDNMFTAKNIEYQHLALQAIRAHHLFSRDVDYVVKQGKVVIVDEFTGRLMPGRRWSDGLHQAIEAKENVMIEAENQTLATITFQNYFKLYDKISGMTGTAETEATEFMQIYDLDVVVIPTNKPMIRRDFNDRIYRTFREKVKAIADEISEVHKKGQPILVGTISIEKSEILSRELNKLNTPHQILNAKFHEKEASIIKQAGKKYSVTIATNMAGRGTDIVLGGYPDFKEELQELIQVDNERLETFQKYLILGELDNAEKLIAEFKGNEKDKAIVALCKVALKNYDFEKAESYISTNLSEKLKTNMRNLINSVKKWKKENDEIKALGGLYIIGTERHESRRIDNQLRGRAGRQGDPGKSRFYISLEDDLMRLFGSDRMANVMQRLGLKEGQEIEHPWISKAIENAQKKVEARNFEIRKHLLEYDNVMNQQREFIYTKRNQILKNADLKQDVLDSMKDVIELKMEQFLGSKNHPDNWDLDGFNKDLLATFNVEVPKKDIDVKTISYGEFFDIAYKRLAEFYNKREEEFGSEVMRELERGIMLEIIDTKWKEHLYDMDYLKEGISFRSYAERDPLVEYKFEGFKLFQRMVDSIKTETLEFLFKVQPVVDLATNQFGFMVADEKMPDSIKTVHSEFGQFDALKQSPGASAQRPHDGQRHQVISDKKIGRNDPCWCGSGKKYKYCHGRLEK